MLRTADEIRQDLGSVNELFDEAAHRRLIDGESFSHVKRDLDQRLKTVRGRVLFRADAKGASVPDPRAVPVSLRSLLLAR